MQQQDKETVIGTLGEQVYFQHSVSYRSHQQHIQDVQSGVIIVKTRFPLVEQQKAAIFQEREFTR